jgi:glycopeptide antibiotics resistance protein
MQQNKQNKKFLSSDEKTLRRLAISAAVMYAWILIWALVLKLGNEELLINNYTNLKQFTPLERLEWDLIPFNYRGEGAYKTKIIMDTVMNCFVFAPFGVMFGYIFKKRNILRDVAICLGFAVCIEGLQFVTMLGNPATEDLITNPIGYFIGLAFYALIFKRLSVRQSVKVAVVTNTVFGVTVAVSLVTVIRSAELIFQIITKTL